MIKTPMSLLREIGNKEVRDDVLTNACMQSHLSHVQLFATPWTVAHQDPLSMGYSKRVLEWVAIPFSRGSS